MSTPERGSLRILLFLHAINFDRVLEGFLRELLRRGHTVEVCLEREKRALPIGAGTLFPRLAKEYPGFGFSVVPSEAGPWLPIATRLRYAIDYLRYLEPEFAGADALRERARKRAPALVRGLVERGPFATTRRRHAFGRGLRKLEAAIPVPPQPFESIAAGRPDAVLVSPLVGLGSTQGDLIRAARRLGVHSALVVASWDNLTNKGLIRDVPDVTIVWNDRQVQEATELHALPPERVVATGAHSFDHWFSWRPSTTPEEFAAKVGLRPGRFLLYVCSSGFITGDESEFIRDWLGRLRTSGHRELRELGVIIRPHPQHALYWDRTDIVDAGRTVVFPRGGVTPLADQAKADYFDSIHHCSAVIGINTSALVESAIVGRPVLTVLDERFRSTQGGTLHFAHLTGEHDDGVLLVAHDWDEHFAQLATAVSDPKRHADRLGRFVEEFVRPRGLARPAAPIAVDALEQAVAAAAIAAPEPSALARGLAAATPGMAVAGRVERRLRALWRLRRRLVKRARNYPLLLAVRLAGPLRARLNRHAPQPPDATPREPDADRSEPGGETVDVVR